MLQKEKKVDVPLKQLIDDIDGKEIMKNTAALGASVAALGIPKDIMEEVVRASYPKKDCRNKCSSCCGRI